MILTSLILAVSSPDPTQVAYATQHAAMVAAAHAAVAVSDEYESGGALYKVADGYHFTLPACAHEYGAVDYNVRLPVGATLVALFHTHPGKTGTALEFSRSDRELQRKMRLPMYVVAIVNQQVIAIGADAIDLTERDRK